MRRPCGWWGSGLGGCEGLWATQYCVGRLIPVTRTAPMEPSKVSSRWPGARLAGGAAMTERERQTVRAMRRCAGGRLDCAVEVHPRPTERRVHGSGEVIESIIGAPTKGHEARRQADGAPTSGEHGRTWTEDQLPIRIPAGLGVACCASAKSHVLTVRGSRSSPRCSPRAQASRAAPPRPDRCLERHPR